jgi:four helix bundle protein
VVKGYRDLKVWQKAMELVVESYRLTKFLPRSELFGLISQIQRAAVSIPANIAEGHGREHLGDYLRSLSIANGSLMELETHILLIRRLYRIGDEAEAALAMTDELGRMLSGLTKRLKERLVAA